MVIFKKVWFWLGILSIIVCLNDFYGNDQKHILLIGLNPLLDYMIYKESFRDWIINDNQIEGKILLGGYVIHFVSYILLGIIIDLLFFFNKQKK
ncbi:hypothetical protein EGH10_11005 [Brevibacillus laterosporus]|uniref:Uncharacterized protein n=1 Tax=Brevibacillus laterosporus LMG 15441 TaxID=1042163 RepID=A0A075QYH5_BRELA|nr:hypothetical protein BRLA_c010670 [Brevibacillus laterosporus LMG 15441]RJL10811.1 hypothetical protein DM460_12115 [Brevibacillus laterosporus]TPH11160.1 hypothetical protein EGH10_11005 [Brevibacillus laterosporus]HAS01132.1 hypothetical protein [Brevibacillus sp.]